MPFLVIFFILYNVCYQFHCRTIHCQSNSEAGSWASMPREYGDMHIPPESAFVPALTMKTGMSCGEREIFIVLGEQERERKACEQVDLRKQA